MSISKDKQAQYERLSALLDGELQDPELNQSIDEIINDPELFDKWQTSNLIKDALHEQLDPRVFSTSIASQVSMSLENEPAHFVSSAVDLQQPSVHETNWLHKFFANKMVSGLSVAASVMFVSLFVFQQLNIGEQGGLVNQTVSIAEEAQNVDNLAATGAGQAITPLQVADKTQYNKRYQWIEADPALSRQIHEYVNEHKFHSSMSPLKPQIRTVSYQTD